MKKLLSIVTVHKNETESLKATMASVLGLERRNEVEWIVIDGGSDCKSWKKHLDEIRKEADVFVSESDKGVYDAMNKGVNHAASQYILFLNAGDVLIEKNIVAIVASYLNKSILPDIIMFQAREGSIENGYRLKRTRAPSRVWYGMPTHHQAMLFNQKVFAHRLYDLDFPIAADFKLVSEIKHAHGLIYIDSRTLCDFQLGGISDSQFYDGLREQQKIRETVFKIPRLINTGVYLLKVCLRVFRKVFPKAYAGLRYERGN